MIRFYQESLERILKEVKKKRKEVVKIQLHEAKSTDGILGVAMLFCISPTVLTIASIESVLPTQTHFYGMLCSQIGETIMKTTTNFVIQKRTTKKITVKLLSHIKVFFADSTAFYLFKAGIIVLYCGPEGSKLQLVHTSFSDIGRWEIVREKYKQG